MTEHHSKYNYTRPSRTEQNNRPVTQNSVERWPENWEEKFCKLRNIWSHHTKLTSKKLKADSSNEKCISSKKKVFLEYLLQKKEKEQSSSNTEYSQHEEEEEAENKVDSSSEETEESCSDQVEQVEEICQEKALSIRSTELSSRLKSGNSKCSELYSKKVVKKCQFDERQYIKDLKNLHSNIETFLHLSSTYLDKSCCKKQMIEKPYVKKCNLEGYDGPFVVESKKHSVKSSMASSQLGFMKMPERPVKGQLSKKQLEKLSLYNAPNIEIYGGRYKRFNRSKTCGDVNCPFSDEFKSIGSKKSNKNYSYCDLKLNNFCYGQVCHQPPTDYRCCICSQPPQNYPCCTCAHQHQENLVQKKGFFKNKLKKKPSYHPSSCELNSNSYQSDISIKSRKKIQNKSSDRSFKHQKRSENLKSKQSSQKSIKSRKTKQSDHSTIILQLYTPKTKSKKSVKSDKLCDDKSSKRSTKSTKSRPGILKECCGVEEKSVKSMKLEKKLSKTSTNTGKSVKGIKPDKKLSKTSAKTGKSGKSKSEKSDKTNKKHLEEYKLTAIGSSTSKNSNKFDRFCDTASKKSSKHRSKIIEECCELEKKSKRSLKARKHPSKISAKTAKSFKSKNNYNLQEKRSTRSKSNNSIKKITKKSSSGSYKSAKQHSDSVRGDLKKTKSKLSIKNLISKNKKIEDVIENDLPKCKCEGLKRGENLTPVNPKGLRKKKKHKKQENIVEDNDDDDDDSFEEISSRCTSLFPTQKKNVCCEDEESRKSLVRKQFLKLYRKRILLQLKQSEKYPKITIKLRSKKYKNNPYRKKSSVHSRTFKKYIKDSNNLLQNPVLRSKKYKANLPHDCLLFPVIRKKYGQNNKRVSFVKSKQKNIYCQY